MAILLCWSICYAGLMLCWANVVLFAMLGYLLRCAGLFAMLFAMFFVLLFASMLLLLSPASHAMYDNMYALLLSQQPFAVVLLIATVLNLRLILRSCHLVANDGRVDMGNDKPFKSGHAADHTEIPVILLLKVLTQQHHGLHQKIISARRHRTDHA